MKQLWNRALAITSSSAVDLFSQRWNDLKVNVQHLHVLSTQRIYFNTYPGIGWMKSFSEDFSVVYGPPPKMYSYRKGSHSCTTLGAENSWPMAALFVMAEAQEETRDTERESARDKWPNFPHFPWASPAGAWTEAQTFPKKCSSSVIFSPKKQRAQRPG